MRHYFARQPRALLAFTFCACPIVVGMFAWGNHLLGWIYGIAYALITCSIGLFTYHAILPTFSWWRTTAVGTIAIAVGYALAFPASINSDMQVLIDMVAVDRSVRAEWNARFSSDDAFGDLSVSTVHLKVVNFTITGSLQSHAEFHRLRRLLGAEGFVIGPLHWDIEILMAGDRIEGLDRVLFQRTKEPQ